MARASVRLHFSSDVRLVDVAHSATEAVGRLAGLDEEAALDTALAVREAVINAVVHGNREAEGVEVSLELSAGTEGLVARIGDRGAGFAPDAQPDPTDAENLMKSSGRGLLLMRSFVDEISFRSRRGGGTEVELVKRRGGTGGPVE